MKKILLGLFLGLSGIVMAAGEVAVGTNVDGTLNISANVIAPLTIVETTPMAFGDIILGASVEAATPGVMTVTGAKGNSVTVHVPESATITKGNIADSAVTVVLESTNNDVAQTLDAAGKVVQTITGEIAAGATKYTGTHTGSAVITVRYE